MESLLAGTGTDVADRAGIDAERRESLVDVRQGFYRYLNLLLSDGICCFRSR